MAPPLSLKARAMQWLAQREHSRIELRRKLLAAVRRRDNDADLAAAASAPALESPLEPTAEVDALLDWLATHRYLSEERFVESRVHARAARFGSRRITQELGQHGVALDTKTAEQLKATELARARTVWLRKFGAEPPSDLAARARQMRFLAGRGFAPEVIRRVLRGDRDD